jgi:excisionase family DNA binding protein
MGVSDAASYLRISESKLYKMTSSQKIPHVKIGRSLRFMKSQLDEFLDKAKIGHTSDTTDEEAEKHVANYPFKKKKNVDKRTENK